MWVSLDGLMSEMSKRMPQRTDRESAGGIGKLTEKEWQKIGKVARCPTEQ